MTNEEKLAKLDQLENNSWEELEGYTSGGIHELKIIERCQRVRETIEYQQLAAEALLRPENEASPHRAGVSYKRPDGGDEGF